MKAIVKLVVFTTVIVSCSEQFVFPDSLQQIVRDKIVPSEQYRTEQSRAVDDFPVANTDTNTNHISQRNLFKDDRFCENGTDFCTEPFTYPSQAIAKASKKQKELVKSLCGDDDLPTTDLRSGLFSLLGSENVCGMLRTHIRPRAARNKKGQFKFLVNMREGEDDYIQLVGISKCLGEGGQCGNGKIFTRHETECRQEYTDHKMVALDEEGEELVVDTFSFPSCCSCYVQRGMEL